MTQPQFNIVEMIELYVALMPLDNCYWCCCCPFCNGDMSMIIEADKNKFYCFDCYARGSTQKFIKLMAAKESNE